MILYQMKRFKYLRIEKTSMIEQSAFLELVGDTPFTRLLDFFITGRNFDYTLTDLARKAGVSWTTLNRIFPKLVERNMVVMVRQVGMAKLYKLNMGNILVLKMVELYNAVLAEKLNVAQNKAVTVKV